jgi:hypothetical protein
VLADFTTLSSSAVILKEAKLGEAKLCFFQNDKVEWNGQTVPLKTGTNDMGLR